MRGKPSPEGGAAFERKQNDDTLSRFDAFRGGFGPFRTGKTRLFIIQYPPNPLKPRKTCRFGRENVIICRHLAPAAIPAA